MAAERFKIMDTLSISAKPVRRSLSSGDRKGVAAALFVCKTGIDRGASCPRVRGLSPHTSTPSVNLNLTQCKRVIMQGLAKFGS